MGVPDERVRDRPLRHPSGDGMGAARHLLEMARDSVVHRRIGREHGRARANDRTAFRHDLDTLARLTMGDIGGIAMKSAAASLDGAGEAGQIPGGMKAALVGETERAAGVETGDGRAVVPFDVDAEAPTRPRSEEHTSELQSLMRISYAVFC